MTSAYQKILTGAREALAIARGEKDAPRVMRRGKDGQMHDVTAEWNSENRARYLTEAECREMESETANLHAEVVAALTNQPRRFTPNTRIPHRAGSAGTNTDIEASDTAASPPAAETR